MFKQNLQNIKKILYYIKFDKLYKLNSNNNYKALIKEIIFIMHNMQMVSSEAQSKQFMQTFLQKTKEKKNIYNKKINIREFLYFLSIYNIIEPYSEYSIITYSDGNIYDHIFMLDAKLRFIILLFLYIGLIKDNIEHAYCINALNSAEAEILLNY